MDKNSCIGRPVRIASLSFDNKYTVEDIRAVMEAEEKKAQILSSCRKPGPEMQWKVRTARQSMCSSVAAKYRTYVVCPVFLRDEEENAGTRRYSWTVRAIRYSAMTSIFLLEQVILPRQVSR